MTTFSPTVEVQRLLSARIYEFTAQAPVTANRVLEIIRIMLETVIGIRDRAVVLLAATVSVMQGIPRLWPAAGCVGLHENVVGQRCCISWLPTLVEGNIGRWDGRNEN